MRFFLVVSERVSENPEFSASEGIWRHIVVERRSLSTGIWFRAEDM